jgi:hypothetical protein
VAGKLQTPDHKRRINPKLSKTETGFNKGVAALEPMAKAWPVEDHVVAPLQRGYISMWLL